MATYTHFSTYTGPWTHYKYYVNASTYMTLLTPDIVKYLNLSKTFQQITWDKKYLIPYFKQKIPDYDE